MKHAPWTSGQLARLRQHYPTMPWDFLLAEFAPHTRRSIVQTAFSLGIKRRGAKWLAMAAAHRPVVFGGPRV